MGSGGRILGVSCVVFTFDCGILWFRLWIFSWEDNNVSKTAGYVKQETEQVSMATLTFLCAMLCC